MQWTISLSVYLYQNMFHSKYNNMLVICTIDLIWALEKWYETAKSFTNLIRATMYTLL